MMILLDRRSILVILSSSTTSNNNRFVLDESFYSIPFPPPPDYTLVKDWVGCICSCTPNELRDSIKRSGGRFLYRGAEDNHNNNDQLQRSALERQIQQRLESIQSSRNYSTKTQSQILSYIQNPEPDLLWPETYNDNPMALSYFQCLEERLSPPSSSTSGNNNYNNNSNNVTVIARPTNGHIGTSDSKEAGKWGDVVSIWPLGDTISYVWPQDRETFCDIDQATATATKRRKENPGKVQHLSNNFLCEKDKLVINQNLVDALVQSREVLFTTSGWTEE